MKPYTMSSKGSALLRDIEELRLKPYNDQTGKTITSWTEGASIGYGHLISEQDWHKYANGITAAKANQLFVTDLVSYVNAVNKGVSIGLSQNQFDALVIFAYNIGTKGFASSSALKLINNSRAKTPYSSIEQAWKAWNKSQGVINQGLINRRNMEWNLYSKGIYKRW